MKFKLEPSMAGGHWAQTNEQDSNNVMINISNLYDKSVMGEGGTDGRSRFTAEEVSSIEPSTAREHCQLTRVRNKIFFNIFFPVIYRTSIEINKSKESLDLAAYIASPILFGYMA